MSEPQAPDEDDELVMVLSECDPLIVDSVASAFEQAGLEFVKRESDLKSVFGGGNPGTTVEYWILADDMPRARAILNRILPAPEERREERFDDLELPDDGETLEPLPPGELPLLFWSSREGGPIVLCDPLAAYARITSSGGPILDATVTTSSGSWNVIGSRRYPGSLVVERYLPGERLLLDLDAREPAALVRESSGEPISPLRSGDGETWETEEDWVIRLHEASGPGTERIRVEIDPSILGRPELLLLLSIAELARRRRVAQASDF